MPARQKPRTPAKPKPNAPPPPTAKASNSADASVTPLKKGGVEVSPPAAADTPNPLQEYKQMQDDEVEVLKSIFMEDFKHVEKAGAWNVSTLDRVISFMKDRKKRKEKEQEKKKKENKPRIWTDFSCVLADI